MKVTTAITKQQAAALMRGKLLPYRGYSATLNDGRILGHKPDGTFWLTSEQQAEYPKATCSFPGCSGKVYSSGLCNFHFSL